MSDVTRDLEILALKAETNRLTLEGLLVLGQLESHEEHLKQFVRETRVTTNDQPRGK